MTAPAAPWSITYADGSANVYQVTADGDVVRFAYRPVTPERSSTGMYSGGEPRSGLLEAPQVAALWRQVRELEANTPLHVADRGKGTGAFQLTEATHAGAFIIVRGPALLAFDELVHGW